MPIDRPARQHARWLSLLDISGPFLSMPVLLESFPQGLDHSTNESEVRHRANLAYDEWARSQNGAHSDVGLHTRWLRFVLEEVLEMQPDTILVDQALPPTLAYTVKEYGETLRPTAIIQSPYEQKPRLFIQLYPARQALDRVVADRPWKASPATRMLELLRNVHAEARLGLVTNGRHWMLIDAPPNETTGYYTWDAALWSEEPLTLQAFRSLLSMNRFFSVPEEETLTALLKKSAQKQQETTDRLGKQVRQAIETLVKTLDRLDKDSLRTLLHTVTEKELYESALTIMMRLVFLLSAEERDLLMLGTPLYDENYAISTMAKQLQDQADQQTEEVIGLRADAWSRLLATFRVLYGGVEHADMRLPAYGGRLFDPDRYPFLEGRAPGTSWQDTPARPLNIDNRTVLHLLRALQYLNVSVPGGGTEPRRLSFRGLDVEDIGHVYEGLLDHTAARATTTILGLIGSAEHEPEVTLEDVEAQARAGTLLSYLQEITGRSSNSLQKGLNQRLEEQRERSRLMAACDNQQALFDRILPYAALLRKDSLDNYVLVTPGSIYITRGNDRRSTGTHYTPRSLTEPIVQHALDPLVYIGPAEGLPEEQWQLKKAEAILDLKVCDMAMGSGAFLVQSCRYLSEKLVMAWEQAEQTLERSNGQQRPLLTTEGQRSQHKLDEELLPEDREERLAIARRLIAERCIYGVDKNPMAAEMAKLSLWLITLAYNKPFTFLDHALRHGDSLLGVNERQLINWSMDAKEGTISDTPWIRGAMIQTLPAAIRLRKEIRAIHERDVHDVEIKERKLHEAEEAMELARLGADLLIAITLKDAKSRPALQGTLGLRYFTLAATYETASSENFRELGWQPIRTEFARLRAEVDELLQDKRPFHWSLEFPEVFVGKGDDAGFSAIVSNPPFIGGKKITGPLGTDYRNYLLKHLASDQKGNADLCAYFFLRAAEQTQRGGMCGLVATNSIAQGDTREVGLDQIVASGWVIPRAVPSRPWPGEANLEVAYVWLRNGAWQGSYVLNNTTVSGITSFLTVPGKAHGKPYRLDANTNKSFQGSVVLGMGFVLTPDEAAALIAKDPLNNGVLYPYLNGEDLNSRPDQSPSRWVINFHDWPLAKAETYLNCMAIVREKVKPERDRLGLKSDTSAKGYAKLWWQYGRRSVDLYSAIAGMERVLVIALTSRTCAFTFAPNNIVFSHATGVFALDRTCYFAILQSAFHVEWVFLHGSSMKNDLRYTPSDCFETFPFPLNIEDLEYIGERYYTHRQSIMLARQEGLTKTYNRFHSPGEMAADIVKLRELHWEMDRAVARAYGWEDLRLEHGFHETKQGLRWTISETAKQEVLDRLLLLNHKRHAEEVRLGLLEPGTKGKTKKSTGGKGEGKGLAEGKEGKQKMKSGKDGAGTTGNVEGEKKDEIEHEDDLEQNRLF